MAESTPIQILDDDEFDWEAAVREIDFACENSKSKPSCSSLTALPNNLIQNDNNTNYDNIKNVGNCSKQSTLDKFMAKSVPKPNGSECSAGDGVSRVATDPVAANTKVYPVPKPRPSVLSTNGSEGSGGDGVSRVPIDPEAANTWVYPVNIPLREYQFAITKKALFSNTLVALPTGLGKTLIAAVVMYNYFQWFPEGKIVFAAPSRPLVTQQIEACHNIVAVPQEWTIDMTGQTNPTRRACFWKTKRVFFVTPQVLERDIQSGTCLVDHLVCLVIDEAHRALGNYSYCVALRELMDVPVQLRILALTATPGSKQQTIQTIINNLHISTLEYRNENDPDVSPYVHNRKLELIEVAMGNDAVEINDLLLQIIGPFTAKLSAIGVLPQRDYRTLSPVELINARDKLCQAPPPDLTKNKYEEANKCLTALITLYHIRKLLSSHGIRPAYEMLEEKLKEGRFARLMSTNGNIQKVKFLMQQSLSHGAPSPKLSKMLEVLIDHFKTNDPQKSRVIIFSNFRGSVRDIMDALAKVGELVKATEFIGQSTGKTIKGQTQKVQQAVLEKFRAGKYNVIVATSIGEEGLDIIEVDMVICFDANISPLRMIQRMGRTGRKNDGRVVVLACEGSEIKGYMRKQANSKVVKKHMRNGGLNSFRFHLSPRMVPHIYKPEVQYVEFSIQRFIPNGKTEKDDHTSRTSLFKEKLTDSQNNLIAEYFDQTNDGTWKPSLIAFPQFQAFPSKVHKVVHSFKTRILIDTMQQLQELSFPSNGGNYFFEHEGARDGNLEVDIIEDPAAIRKDSPVDEKSCDGEVRRGVSDFEVVSPLDTTKTLEKHNTSHTLCQNATHSPCQNATHSYLFGSDFISIDALGKVQISSVPLLPLKGISDDKLASGSNALLQNCSIEDNCNLRSSNGKDEEDIIQADPKTKETFQSKCLESNNFSYNGFPNFISQEESTQDEFENNFQTPRLNDKSMKEAQGTGEMLQAGECNILLSDQECSNDAINVELSPGLTNFIKTGIVPESPINDSGVNDAQREDSAPEITIPDKSCDEQLLKSTSLENGKAITDNYTCDKVQLMSPVTSEIQTPVMKIKNSACARSFSASPIVEGIQTSLEDLTHPNCSSNWKFNSGDKSESLHRTRKFKRLRKVGDLRKSRNLGPDISTQNKTRYCPASPQYKLSKGTRNSNDNVRAFIEEEAEVSSEAGVSDDEENDRENDSYDDSFIDDQTDTTQACTQAEASRVDMMAIYRRSLFTQSPVGSHLNNLDCMIPGYTVSTSRSESLSGSTPHSPKTPQTISIHQITGGADHSKTIVDISSEVKPCKNRISPKEDISVVRMRKRKFSYFHPGAVPAVNLEHQFSLCPGAAGSEMDPQVQGELNRDDEDIFGDDQFYEGLDLDAIEAQATLLVKQKLETATQKQDEICKCDLQNCSTHTSPTFDLGI